MDSPAPEGSDSNGNVNINGDEQTSIDNNITDPYDTDVLCGRGGAALRHPGNQTYRRLVNLNKGLYITCLKTEKLKISRSIVAAIREQRGRFLEKNKDASWYDIGDKKAIEKTSQALREGQPKLRQKIVEMGGTAGSLMDSQFGPGPGGPGADVYADLPASATSAGGDMMPPPPPPPHQHQQQQHQQQQAALAAVMQHQHQQDQVNRHQQNQELNHEMMLQRLSLQDASQGTAEIDTRYMQHQQLQNQQHQAQLLQHQRNNRRMHGLPAESQHSIMSDFSGISGRSIPGSIPNESLMSMDSSFRRALTNLTGSQYAAGGQFESIESLLIGMNNNQSNFSNLSSGSAHNMYNHNTSAMHNGSSRQGVNAAAGSAHAVSAAGSSAHPGAHASTTSNHSGTSGLALGASAHTAGSAFTAGSETTGASGNSGMSQSSPGSKLAGFDRRRVFAGMKYSRPPSVRLETPARGSNGMPSHGPPSLLTMDGMPDIHMVESNLSLHSNMSLMTSGGGDLKATPGSTSSFPFSAAAAAAAAAPNANSNDYKQQQQQHDYKQHDYKQHDYKQHDYKQHDYKQHDYKQRPAVETAKVVDHSSRERFHPDAMSSGSRHSLMSGLSRISDTSIFSDLSRKIGNVSTRSITMSDISAIDIQEVDNEEESTSSGLEHPSEKTPEGDYREKTTSESGRKLGFASTRSIAMSDISAFDVQELDNEDNELSGNGLDTEGAPPLGIYGGYRKKATTEFDP